MYRLLKCDNRSTGRLLISVVVATVFLATGFAGDANAQSGVKGKSGLPLPRFVSLKSKRINMRVGPGRDYKVDWLYLKKGLPMEIIQEFDNWRKVRDPEGQEGWIFHSLLSGKRTAIVTPWERGNQDLSIVLFDAPDSASPITARLEPGVIARINSCERKWCELSIDDLEGYVEQSKLWGVYPDETLDN